MRQYFAASPHQPRVRRAADAWLAVTGLVLVVWAAASVDRVTELEQALVDLSQSVPLWFEQTYRVAFFGGLLLVVILTASVIAQGRARLDLLRDIGLAVTATFGMALAVVWWLNESVPAVLPEFTDGTAAGTFPILRVAILTGVVVVASPHLARPVRRFGWLMIGLVAVSGFGLGFGLPTDAVGGVGLGLIAGGTVMLVFGSPTGYPDRAVVAAALGDLGLRVAALDLAHDTSWGMRRLTGSLDDGTRIEVKAYGRDAIDAQLAARAWRFLWYRESGQTFTYSRLQAVEHEALVMLTAEHHGVATPNVLAVGIGGRDMALLAVAPRGEPMTHAPLTSAALGAAWRAVDHLHRARIAHGSLTLEAVALESGTPVIGDLGAASLGATDVRLSLDIVSFLYATAVEVGSEAAVAAALSGMGSDRLAAALPYLQSPALTRDQRRRVDDPDALVTELRDAVARITSAELPEPARLRRVRVQDLIMPLLSLVAASALLGMLSDIDFAAVWDVAQDASWAWIVVGFGIGHAVFFPDATGMLYATGYPLPLKPLVVLQISARWIGLAVPSAAGRVAMNTMFLRKYGVEPALALTQGVLDGLAGFVTEAGILLIALISSDLTLDLGTADINWPLLLAIVGILILAAVIAVFRIERLRESVLPALHKAWDMLWGLLRDPGRTFGLLGSNFASRVVLAVTLWCVLRAIGTPLPLVTALVVTVATNLLAGLVPIPGGIGVAEAVLTSFLTVAGLGAEEAFTAAVIFRIATFYIPAGEGFFAMRWLEKTGHL